MAVSLAAALLVAGWPSHPDKLILTRPHGTFDPLQGAVLLRFGVTSLIQDPSRYFSPPFLYPDPNPLRGTEPLLAEALLALPVRLAVGDRPALQYSVVRILSLWLLGVFAGLLVEELGARAALTWLAGSLTVCMGTTLVFVDRLQAVSLQWVPLALLFALRTTRRRGWGDVVGFGAASFLAVQASLYTAVMLLAAAPFVAPALWPQLRAPEARSRLRALALAGLAAVVLSILVLLPWLRDRSDLALYTSAAALAEKDWWGTSLANLLASPREAAGALWGLTVPARPDGTFPGTGFALTLLAAVALVLRAGGTRIRVVLAATVLAASLYGACVAESALARGLGGAGLMALLVAWPLCLASRPAATEEDGRLALAASVAFLLALLMAVLALETPVFGWLARLLPPLREIRELRRFLLPAGWAAATGAVVCLERGLRARPLRGSGALVLGLVALVLAERWQVDRGTVRVPPPPAVYAEVRAQAARGGLLELPFRHWNSLDSVYEMLWEPFHGRPIVAGYTGLAPAWYSLAEQVFNEYPSPESRQLLRAWGVGVVLDRRGTATAVEAPRFDDVLEPLEVELPATAGSWASPQTAPALTDGDADTALTFDSAGVELRIPAGSHLGAIELDYGLAFVASPPASVRVLGFVDGAWRERTLAPTGERLRARAADLLMRRQPARLLVLVEPGNEVRYRLISDAARFELAELRVWLTGGATGLTGAAG